MGSGVTSLWITQLFRRSAPFRTVPQNGRARATKLFRRSPSIEGNAEQWNSSQRNRMNERFKLYPHLLHSLWKTYLGRVDRWISDQTRPRNFDHSRRDHQTNHRQPHLRTTQDGRIIRSKTSIAEHNQGKPGEDPHHSGQPHLQQDERDIQIQRPGASRR